MLIYAYQIYQESHLDQSIKYNKMSSFILISDVLRKTIYTNI